MNVNKLKVNDKKLDDDNNEDDLIRGLDGEPTKFKMGDRYNPHIPSIVNLILIWSNEKERFKNMYFEKAHKLTINYVYEYR